MQFLNNDMDQLLQKAADAFEVPVAGADWNGVAQRLDETEKTNVNQGLANGRRFLLLLCFLLTSLVCNKYLQVNFGTHNRMYSATLNETAVTESLVKATENKVVATGTIANQTIEQETTTTQNLSNSFYPLEFDRKGENLIVKETPANTTVAQKDKDFLDVTTAASPSAYFRNISKRPDPLQQALSGHHLEQSPIVFTAATELQPQKEKRKNSIYVGVVAGPELSTVKWKQTKTGLYGGVVAGYRFHKNWALETGLNWNKKNYYATGKDMNTKRLGLPSHTTVIHAEGYCQMFEIPVQLQYHFKSGKQGNWFAGVGASSYLMQKEDYDYLYERYNVQYYGTKYYNTSTQNWLATLNLSAGYQQQLGHNLNLRIEPYIKLPINGMGIAKLPITSTGLQVGLTLPVR